MQQPASWASLCGTWILALVDIMHQDGNLPACPLQLLTVMEVPPSSELQIHMFFFPEYTFISQNIHFPEYAFICSTSRIFLALFSGHLPNFSRACWIVNFMPHSKSWRVIASKCPHFPLRYAVSNFPLHNPRFCTQTTALLPWDPVCYPSPHRPLVILYPVQTTPPWSPSVSLSCQHRAETMARSFSAVFSLLQTTAGSCFAAAKADICISLCY